MLGSVLIVLITFDLEHQRHLIGEPNQIVGSMSMTDPQILVGNHEFEMVITGIKRYGI